MINSLKMFLVDDLCQHPQNAYYFDDMEGQKWSEFLDSVRTSGVIEPIVVTQDNMIVSGHQRVRACKELGISEVPGRMRKYETDDDILKDLLETNVRQRGNINSSALKLARIIAELERIYGIKHGNNQRDEEFHEVEVLNTSKKNKEFHEVEVLHKSQDEIIETLGLNKSSYHYAKKLLDLIPELQDEVDSGNISATTASRVLAQLSTEDQAVVYASLPKDVKLSQREVQEYVDEMLREKNEEIKLLSEDIEALNDDIEDMVDRLSSSMKETRVFEDEAKAAYHAVELAKKEIEALNDKLREDAINIASEYILERDKAVDEARLIKERYYKVSDELSEHKKEIVRLQKQIEESAQKNNKLGGGMLEHVEKIATLTERVGELEKERETLLKRQAFVDPKFMLSVVESAIRVVQDFAGGYVNMSISPDIKIDVDMKLTELDTAAKKAIEVLRCVA